MQTIQLDIQDDKLTAFLTIVDNLKSDILDIEPIERDSPDCFDVK